MKQFKLETFSKADQLSARLENLKNAYGEEYEKYLKMVLEGDVYRAFDDEFWTPDIWEMREGIYINCVTIVKYFGKDLVKEVISSNNKSSFEKQKAV